MGKPVVVGQLRKEIHAGQSREHGLSNKVHGRWGVWPAGGMMEVGAGRSWLDADPEEYYMGSGMYHAGNEQRWGETTGQACTLL